MGMSGLESGRNGDKMREQKLQEMIANVVKQVLAEGKKGRVPVEVSARHVHLTKEDTEALFGKGHVLTPRRELSQPGQFLAEERVTIVTARGEFRNVAVLGPARSHTQVELSCTDARSLGVEPLIRQSGNTAGCPDICLLAGQNVVVAKEAPSVCPKCGCTHFTQDPDTLDTWFSSALWPFSTLGWPKETEDLKYFYPTDVLVTGYDIIFFWVIRMIFSGYEQMKEKPFKTVLFHGLVRDSQGRKMSKSLGNGIDPLEIIDQYGADALRLTLITGNAPGNDMRFYYERVEAARNFANKAWNASRFIMMNMEGKEIPENAGDYLEPADKWIISKLNRLVKEVTDNMEKYELGIAVQKVYDFIWDEFCDWYIEMVKPRLYNSDDKDSQNAALYTLKTVLIDALKLLHPYMPFITEEIFCTLQSEEESIMISSWPVADESRAFDKEEKEIEILKEAVRGIRNARTGLNVPPSRKAQVYVVTDRSDVASVFEEGKLFFATLAYASEVLVQKDKAGIADDAVSVVIENATVYMPFAELVDIAQEIERLKKEEKRLQGEIARSNGMLNNEKFVSKAPAAKVEEEKGKLAKYAQMLKQVQTRLKTLQ